MGLETLYQEILAGKPASAPVADRSLWKVTGSDRVRYINGQVTNDVGALAPGTAIYAALLSSKGRLVADLWIAASQDALWIDGPASEADTLEARLRQFLAADDVDLERLSGWTLTRVFPDIPKPVLPAGAFAFRSGRFGLPGWDLWSPEGAIGQFGYPIPEPLLESFRLEARWPRWGAEIHPGDLPQEVGMEPFAISYRKGCYVGQEIVSRLHHIGHPNRALVLVAASPDSPTLLAGSILRRDDEEVGRITSVARSYARSAEIALGIVKRAVAAPGTPLRSQGSDLKVIEPLRMRPEH